MAITMSTRNAFY